MKWRSKRAMRLRMIGWCLSATVCFALIWAQALPVWSMAVLLLFWAPLLLTELCPHCGIPLLFKPQTRIWERMTVCSNCDRQIV